MSVPKYAYTPEFCDGVPCPGDCDNCGKRDEQVRVLALQAGICPWCKRNLSEVREDSDGKHRYCYGCFSSYYIHEDSP